MADMETVKVVALINLPQYGLEFGEEGEIEIDPADLKGRLKLAHMARVKEAKKEPQKTEPPSSEGSGGE